MGPDGKLYLGLRWSKPRLGRYDPKVGKFEYPGMISKQSRLCRVSVATDGRVFCGVSTHAQLWIYDPKTDQEQRMIEKGLDGLAIDPAGNFYCKSGRRMVQYRRTK